MNRMGRLFAILVQLQTKRVVTGKEIAGRFGISLRTVYRDIRALEAAGIPVGSDAGKGYYLAEGYCLPPVMFTLEEAGALITAGKFMESFTDSLLNGHFNSAVCKIRAVLNDRDKDCIEELQNKIGVYGAAQGSLPPESDFMPDIQAALYSKRVLSIRYVSPEKPEPTFRQIEPLGLGFYKFNWHLIAFCKKGA